MVTYVNSPVERTNGGNAQTCCSGESKVFRLVGLGFGLLCLMQLSLNLLLWGHSEGFFNRSDNSTSGSFTPMPCDDIRAPTLEDERLDEEKNQLLHTNEHLLTENARLASVKTCLQKHNKQLKDSIGDLSGKVANQQRLIRSLQTGKERLDEEKNQLLHTNEHLRAENAQLASEKNLLAAEKAALEDANARLREDNRKLKEKLTEAEGKAQPDPFVSSCPTGWWRHMSSCYQLSSEQDTWENAKRKCETQKAHLVILNDSEEEKVVRWFGRWVTVWIGLKGESHSCTWIWKWVDGTFLCEDHRIHHLDPGYDPSSCVFLHDSAWDSGTCQSYRNWVCELQL